MAVGPVHASPLKHPKRVVEGRTVDLVPLFRWWTNQSGTRPLSAWVHITGPIVATNSAGWVIAAHPDHPSAEARGASTSEMPPGGQWRIILKHPPLAEAAEFATLKEQVTQLEAEHTQLEATIKTLSHPHVRGRGAGAVNAQIKASAQGPKNDLQAVDLQIKNCRAKLATFPDPETFRVDCLALDTGQDRGALPIYDYGFVPGGE